MTRFLAAVFLAAACATGASASDKDPAPVPPALPGEAVAVFAGGCFWCLESDFDKLPGVVHTTSGYAGGHLPNPTYDAVNTETTGHKEAVRVVYDTSKLTYAQVLDYFWRHVDPTDDGGQFCDRGDSYRTGVYPVDEQQKREAEASKKAIDASGVLPGPVVTPVVSGATFWPAEIYHQDFHDKDPMRYLPYRKGCGRDATVAKVWAKAKR
jgi:peptide-methionine (S)-S-oxide reductase